MSMKRHLNTLGIMMISLSLCIFLFVIIVPKINATKADSVIEDYVATYIDASGQPTKEAVEIVQNAIDYNLHGFEDGYYIDKAGQLEGPDGIVGYLEIEKISLSLPIYREFTDENITNGCAIVPWLSLPVGGEGTHAAIGAHSGLADRDGFNKIHDLVIGDRFSVTCFGYVVQYEVENITVIRPEDFDQNVRCEFGKDYLTLFTCTPIGSTEKRLLVRGARVG